MAAGDAKSKARPAIKRRIVEGGICALPLIAKATPATRRDACPFAENHSSIISHSISCGSKC